MRSSRLCKVIAAESFLASSHTVCVVFAGSDPAKLTHAKAEPDLADFSKLLFQIDMQQTDFFKCYRWEKHAASLIPRRDKSIHLCQVTRRGCFYANGTDASGGDDAGGRNILRNIHHGGVGEALYGAIRLLSRLFISPSE